MNILVIGGTRFFGIPMMEKLIESGHEVTVATRGNTGKLFGDRVEYLKMDRTHPEEVRSALKGKSYDTVIDKIAYCSNDVRSLLEHVHCDRYILMSTCSVYKEEHPGLTEEEFDPLREELVWTERTEDYAFSKRSAECAAARLRKSEPLTAVRYPIVLGEHDHTGRLRFYAEHVMREKPMFVDDEDFGLSFIGEEEAGEFIAFLAEHPLDGPVNGSMNGLIRIGELIRYLERKTGKKAILSPDGESAPFNGLKHDWTFDTRRAKATGFSFGSTETYVRQLLDRYLETV